MPETTRGHFRYYYVWRQGCPEACGGGPRSCLGAGFAWLEGLLVLATLAQTWRMPLVPDSPVEPWGLVTLRPKQGIQVHLARR